MRAAAILGAPVPGEQQPGLARIGDLQGFDGRLRREEACIDQYSILSWYLKRTEV